MRGSFLDTNAVLYLMHEDNRKSDRIENLLRQSPTISVQVLNETANVLRRKFSWPYDDIDEFLSMVRMLTTVVPLDEAVHTTGLAVAARYQLSIYDAMIVAAALLSDCEVLYSEDMQDGLRIDEDLRIVNPFGG